MKGFFFESVGVPGGSPKLGKGNSDWVPSAVVVAPCRDRGSLVGTVTTRGQGCDGPWLGPRDLNSR